MLGNLLKVFGKKSSQDDDLEFDVQSDKEAKRSNYLRMESPAPNFIPYACHYDKHTILTKNGELLQTIKIVGFTYEALGGDNLNLRETVRKAISENVKDANFSLYLNTIRKKKNLDPAPKFKSFFSDQLHKKWVMRNQWDNKYINELHITIIHQGMPLNVNALNAFYKISFTIDKKHSEKVLAQASKELNMVVDSVLQSLASFGAERLELVYDEQMGYHSELLEFFGNIIHLDESPMPLPMTDLSKYLAKYKVAFGNDALEVRKDKGKFFATVFSVKEYHELSTEAIDKFLQLNQQFVITQTVNFMNPKQGIKYFRYQDYILKLSKDKEMREMLGIDKIMKNVDRTSAVSVCESQVTVMVVADTLDKLESEVRKTQKALGKDIGLAIVREDLNLEHCFWSQLPGNFHYITRKAIIATQSVGGFASLHNFPAGSLTSKWGNAITLLRTALGTPYFFNFHVQDNGHTIIVGNQDAGKATLVNFLLSEASKLTPNVFYLDNNHESEIYVRAMGGTYLSFDFDKTDLAAKFNPLLLSDNQENRDFLKYWFLFLADKYMDTENIDKFSKAAERAVAKLYTLPQEKRRLKNIAEFFVDAEFSAENKVMITKTKEWYGDGKYAHIFDNEKDSLVYNNNIIGINMTPIYDRDLSESLPVMAYFLHFFKIYFLGTPSIMVVANANKIFSNIYFEENLAEILNDLTKRNSIVLADASFSSKKVFWSDKVAKIFQDKMATKFFLPDNEAGYENIKRIFKLSEEEEMYLEALDPNNRQFIIRQSDVSIVSELRLDDFEPELEILSADEEFAKHCFNIMVETGSDPNDWVPKIYHEMDEEVKRKEAEESITVDSHDSKDS